MWGQKIVTYKIGTQSLIEMDPIHTSLWNSSPPELQEMNFDV